MRERVGKTDKFPGNFLSPEEKAESQGGYYHPTNFYE
jgi:hypothetical protein